MYILDLKQLHSFKSINIELNRINQNSKIFNKKISKPAINKSDINSLIEKLGNKASQKLTQNKVNFIRNNIVTEIPCSFGSKSFK